MSPLTLPTQGFPDAFHLGTLDNLLGALPELQPEVKVHAIMASLMDRLAKYAESDAEVMRRLLDMQVSEEGHSSSDLPVACSQFLGLRARVSCAHEATRLIDL